MAKKKETVSDEEVEIVQGVAGAKAGLSIASQMELLKAKSFAIPMILGSLAGVLLPGEETKKKIKGAIKMVKEANTSKAEVVFDKLSKCKTKKKMVKKANLNKEAISAGALGTIITMAGGLAPKPRQFATSVATTAGKNIAMKKLINLPKPKL